MTAPRRTGAEDSATRHRLLDIAERLMLEEGYAAVGVRRVAREADVNPALVIYYFRTLDDLFLALIRRNAEREMERQTAALRSEHFLRELWALEGHSENTALILEFMALANHRKAVRAELADYAERYRTAQIDAIKSHMRKYHGNGGNSEELPAALLVVLEGLSRIIVTDKAAGVTYGHAEALALVDDLVRRFEENPAAVFSGDRVGDGPISSGRQ